MKSKYYTEKSMHFILHNIVAVSKPSAYSDQRLSYPRLKKNAINKHIYIQQVVQSIDEAEKLAKQ